MPAERVNKWMNKNSVAWNRLISGKNFPRMPCTLGNPGWGLGLRGVGSGRDSWGPWPALCPVCALSVPPPLSALTAGRIQLSLNGQPELPPAPCCRWQVCSPADSSEVCPGEPPPASAAPELSSDSSLFATRHLSWEIKVVIPTVWTEWGCAVHLLKDWRAVDTDNPPSQTTGRVHVCWLASGRRRSLSHDGLSIMWGGGSARNATVWAPYLVASPESPSEQQTHLGKAVR